MEPTTAPQQLDRGATENPAPSSHVNARPDPEPEPADAGEPLASVYAQAFALVAEPFKALPQWLRGTLVVTVAALVLWVKVLGGTLPGQNEPASTTPTPAPGPSVTCFYVSPGASCAPP